MIERALIIAFIAAAIFVAGDALADASQIGSISELWDCLGAGWSPEACGL